MVVTRRDLAKLDNVMELISEVGQSDPTPTLERWLRVQHTYTPSVPKPVNAIDLLVDSTTITIFVPLYQSTGTTANPLSRTYPVFDQLPIRNQTGAHCWSLVSGHWFLGEGPSAPNNRSRLPPNRRETPNRVFGT